MTCYRDMTFCPGAGCVKFGPCHRSLTDDVRAAAKEFGMDVDQFCTPQKLDCYALTATTNDGEDLL